jgi:hypothetical protein
MLQLDLVAIQHFSWNQIEKSPYFFTKSVADVVVNVELTKAEDFPGQMVMCASFWSWE